MTILSGESTEGVKNPLRTAPGIHPAIYRQKHHLNPPACPKRIFNAVISAGSRFSPFIKQRRFLK